MQDKQLILIIDDEVFDLKRSSQILKNDYDVICATSGKEALECLETVRPSLILLDIVMPEMNGFEVVKRIKANEKTAEIPVIFLTGNAQETEEMKGFQLGSADYIRKPFIPDIMLSKVATQIELYSYRTRMQELLKIEQKKVLQVTLDAITAIAKAEEAKDSYTNQHSERVAEYAGKIAEKLGWSSDEIANVRMLALLHDIGKIGIPDYILNKHENLSSEEYDIMKQHVVIGNKILGNFSAIQNLSIGALYHHEKWDGSGYIFGLKGEEIPIQARIIGVADAYDAMTSDRIYRGVLEDDYVINEIKQGSGTQFDPKLVDIMLEVIAEQKEK